jgi:hypothetical protein
VGRQDTFRCNEYEVDKIGHHDGSDEDTTKKILGTKRISSEKKRVF